MKSRLQRLSRIITFSGFVASLTKKSSPAAIAFDSNSVSPPSAPPLASAPRPDTPCFAHGVGDDLTTDHDEELRSDSPEANARRRERARCAAIIGCKAAAHHPSLASDLAFKTTLSRHEAIQLLEELPGESPMPLPRPTLKGPSLVRINQQQIADQRLKLAINQANYERSVR